jgi:serine/threonine protein kinase
MVARTWRATAPLRSPRNQSPCRRSARPASSAKPSASAHAMARLPSARNSSWLGGAPGRLRARIHSAARHLTASGSPTHTAAPRVTRHAAPSMRPAPSAVTMTKAIASGHTTTTMRRSTANVASQPSIPAYQRAERAGDLCPTQPREFIVQSSWARDSRGAGRWGVEWSLVGRRYEIIRQLGQGGMGVVFEALDREQGVRVALKTVRQLTPDALFRFKGEFRLLQDMQHPNLVSLGELFEDDGQWFFTMELVQGVDLHRWVRCAVVPGAAAEEPAPDTIADAGSAVSERVTDRLEEHTQATRRLPRGAPSARLHTGFDEGRLRDAMRQLAAGLNALHRAGKVHRDVKPSNVLVTPAGRLVILDFGVVADMRADGDEEAAVVGSLAYMSPEQSVGLRVGAASDWYSMGVVLYEALTGVRPFPAGLPGQEARQVPPPPPRSRAPDVPEDLDTLCMALLRFQPEERPAPADILAALGAADLGDQGVITQSQVTQSMPFVGRVAERAELERAFADCRRAGAPIVAVLRGESGVGKSALARHFADGVVATRDALTLVGRCFERETVPYRAFDGIMDALCQHLLRLDQVEAALLLPPSIGLVARLFPVMRRVPAVRKAETGQGDVVDPQELRIRAFGALRELFTRLAARRDLLLLVDDFQWADADSRPAPRRCSCSSPCAATPGRSRPRSASPRPRSARSSSAACRSPNPPSWPRPSPAASPAVAPSTRRRSPARPEDTRSSCTSSCTTPRRAAARRPGWCAWVTRCARASPDSTRRRGASSRCSPWPGRPSRSRSPPPPAAWPSVTPGARCCRCATSASPAPTARAPWIAWSPSTIACARR